MPAHSPPSTLVRIFRWYCRPELHPYIEGDLMELYREHRAHRGPVLANMRFALEVLFLFRPGIVRPLSLIHPLTTNGMYKNFLIIGWRNLRKNRGHAIINVAGLSIGMAAALIMGLWVTDEVTFNSWFSNGDRLTEVMLNQTFEGNTYSGGTIASPLAEAIRTKYNADFEAISLVSYNSDGVLAVEDRKVTLPGRWTEKTFPEMFSLDMRSGSRDAMQDPSTMLISRSAAEALFGDEDPLGQQVKIANQFDMQVGGVYEDFPENTTFAGTRFLLPWENKANGLNTVTDWDNHNCLLFAQLTPDANLTEVSDKIHALPTPYFDRWQEEIMLYPLKKIHLYFPFQDGRPTEGRIRLVTLMGTVGLAILLLACINFMNLATARSEKRATEVGIRKAIGSRRLQLIFQFLTESVFLTFIALFLALIIAYISLPYFNELTGKHMVFPVNRPVFWLVTGGVALVTGLLAGSYPALYLSGFRPVRILKSVGNVGKKAALPRRIMVIIQFTTSVSLIICTIIVYRQISFAKDRPVGYTSESLLSIPINTPDVYGHYDALRQELLQTDVVENMAQSSQQLTGFKNNNSVDWRGKDLSHEIFFHDVTVSPAFGKTIGWKVLNGRDFDDRKSDSTAAVINEAAAQLMGFDDPLGEKVTYAGNQYHIIGVVNNLVTQSPYEVIQPAIFFTATWPGLVLVRIKPDVSIRAALAEIEPVFQKFNPNAPFEYSFVHEEYGHKFAQEQQIGQLASVFAGLAIFISCLGIFGLASFVAERRTREIGIRKVLGASVLNLWSLLSRDFVLLVLFSCALAVPLSLYGMVQWLQHYEYRLQPSWFIFFSACSGALLITLITVSFQSVRAAISDPVKSIRTE